MNKKELALFIGQKIKFFRLQKGWTQQELGEKLKVGETTISNYEKGYRSPKKDMIFDIAKALGTTIDDLFPPISEKEALSDNIKHYRKINKLTQKQLANLLNVKPTAISAWEVGRNKPLLDNVEAMSMIFKIKKSELLETDTNKNVMAANIQRHLDSLGLNVKDFARIMDFKYSTVLDWVNAKTYPRIDKIELMANYFSVEKSDLVETYKDTPNATAKRGRDKSSPVDTEAKKLIFEKLNQLKKGISQKEIIEKTGIAQSTLSQYFSGKRIPTQQNIKKLANFFNVPISEIDPRLNTNLIIQQNDTVKSLLETVIKLSPKSQEALLSFAHKELEIQKNRMEK